MNLKFGAKPAVHTLESMHKGIVLSQHLDALGTPPASSDDYMAAVFKQVGSQDLGMMGNDVAGCCTIADQGHLEMLWSANTGKMIQPSADDVLNEYKRLSGWNGVEDDPSDTGLMIADVCKSMETTGFMGDKFTGFADIMPINQPHARWSIQLFGAAKLGIFVPQSAMDQFDAHKGWTYTGDNNIVGRHDVPAVMYKNNVWFVITWGRLISMGPAFFSHYVTEVKAPLALNWCRQGNVAPNKLPLSQLQAELSWEGPVG